MTPLSVLGEDAAAAVSDLFLDDEEYESFLYSPDVDKVQWRYAHADCDDFAFAISEITGWPVVGINDTRKGPVHRLVRSPDGQLLDVMGWTSADAIKQRYGLKSMTIDDQAAFHSPTLESDEDFVPVVSAILQLPGQPFDTQEFRTMTLAFADQIGMNIERAVLERPVMKI